MPHAPSGADARRPAVAALVLLSLLWAFTWPVMKEGLRFAGPFEFAALRGLPAAIVLFGAMAVLRRPIAPVAAGELAVLGFFQTMGFNALVSLALVSGAAGKTSVLVYTFPFWTLVFARVALAERMAAAQWLAALAAAVGLVLVIEPWNLDSGLAASAFALAAGACWAAASVYAKHVRARHAIDPLAMTAWQAFFGGLMLAGIAVAVPERPIEWTPYFLCILAYSVFLGTAVGWFLWMYALNRLPAGIASLGTLAVPALGVLIAHVWLGEQPHAIELAGMALIGAALGLLSWATARGERRTGTREADA